MRIGFVGDSFANGFGIDKKKSYPYLIKDRLGVDITTLVRNAANNFEILYNSLYLINNKLVDVIVIGWSGITRTSHNYKYENLNIDNISQYVRDNLSSVNDIFIDDNHLNDRNFSLSWNFSTLRPILEIDEKNRKSYFENKDLLFFQKQWDIQLSVVENLTIQNNIKLIHYSVFGEEPINKYPNFLDNSLLEYLAIDQTDSKFKYNIPIFEYGFLGNDIPEEFCDRNLDSNWRLACLEREELRLDQPKKNFLECGHPTETGHKLWCDFLCEKLSKY